jgi:homogentisate 1,2-dioxygenase
MNDLKMLPMQCGFGNQFVSEAVPGTLPQGRNSPQRAPKGLYAEVISGSAFTAPRAENRRTWMYRRRPAVATGHYTPIALPHWKTGAAAGAATPPNPLRWHPPALPDEGVDFLDGVRTMALNGDADAQAGIAIHVVLCNRPMGRRAFMNADAEWLVVPQQGTLSVRTELGRLQAAPGDILLLPRGMAFSIDVDGPSMAYVCENHGAPFRLPELGPIGSNGLANPRDFLAPQAWFDPTDDSSGKPWQIVRKFGGEFFAAAQNHSPYDVIAWHGNLVPYVYDTRTFMTIGSISFDHPDPSIFTVLTSPSDTPGVANCDFVIFPPRWLVMEDTFRPPWYHRNVMSEFMGLVYGQYDAKPEGFRPGGASLHNCMVPHGPDAEAFEKATAAELKPHKLDNTLAFMFETRYRLRITDWAQRPGAIDTAYADCWAGLKDHFRP